MVTSFFREAYSLLGKVGSDFRCNEIFSNTAGTVLASCRNLFFIIIGFYFCPKDGSIRIYQIELNKYEKQHLIINDSPFHVLFLPKRIGDGVGSTCYGTGWVFI